MTNPAVLVSVIAMIGSVITAYSLFRSNKQTTDVSQSKVSSDDWNSLVQANHEQLSRIHSDYKAEIASIIGRFENQIVDIKTHTAAAEKHAIGCEEKLAILIDKVHMLEIRNLNVRHA